jgi:predicted enzyme related to lactoylglutathione lyase
MVFSNHYKPIPGHEEGRLTFEVDSLEAYLERLKKHGISAIPDADGEIFRKIPGGRCFHIANPDGYFVIVRQPETPKTEAPKVEAPKVEAPTPKRPKA